MNEPQLDCVSSNADFAAMVVCWGKSRGVSMASVTSDPELKWLDPMSINAERVEEGDMPGVALENRIFTRME